MDQHSFSCHLKDQAKSFSETYVFAGQIKNLQPVYFNTLHLGHINVTKVTSSGLNKRRVFLCALAKITF